MKKETRANLWFLGIFLVISLPGAVVLFYKKLSPTAPRLDEPDPVLNRLPFMAPLPAPPDMQWFVPPLTEQWLATLTRQRNGGAMLSAVVPGPDWEPVISPHHVFEVMTMQPGAKSTSIGLLLWDPKWKAGATAYDVEVQRKKATASQRAATVVNDSRTLDVPEDVRHELVGLGFEHPPTQIGWLDVRVGLTIEPGDNIQITMGPHGSVASTHAEVQFTYQPK